MRNKPFTASLRGLTAVLVTAGIVAACDDQRATTFEPVGPPSIDFQIAGSPAGLPSGTVGVGGTTVTLTMSSLRALASGAYQFWVVGRDAQNLDVVATASGPILEFFLRDSTDAGGAPVTDPVTGDVLQVTDTNEVSLTDANSYTGTDNAAVFAVEVVITTTGDASNPASANAVFVTLEAAAGATAPSSAQFLWRRIGPGGSGSMSFGNYGGTDPVNTISVNDYVYSVIGSGTGGVRGNEISVEFLEVTRPPVGFFYRGFLIDGAGAGTLVDTLRSTFSVDAAVSRVSLFDVDENGLLPGLSGTSITTSQVRNCVAGSAERGCGNSISVSPSVAANPFGDFLTFALMMDPKGAPAGMGPTTILAADMPDEIKN